MAGQRAAACRADGRVRAGSAGGVAAVGGEDAGEESVHQGPEQGEAGADDADLDFEVAPEGGHGVVPADVFGDGDGVEGL